MKPIVDVVSRIGIKKAKLRIGRLPIHMMSLSLRDSGVEIDQMNGISPVGGKVAPRLGQAMPFPPVPHIYKAIRPPKRASEEFANE